MAASQQDWVNHLRRTPLPAIALTKRHVSKALARPSSSNADYRNIVALDPAFTLSIFRYLADLPNPPREPIATLSHALALTGISPLEAGVADLPTLDTGAGKAHNRPLMACYARAVHAATYLGHWGKIRKDQNVEELMLAALLHDCGEMALCHVAPEQMTALAADIAQGKSREQAAHVLFGFTQDEFNRTLAEVWSLPPLVADSLAVDGAFRARPLGVLLACELARCSALDWDSEQTMELIEMAADYCRQSTDQTAAELHSLSAECARQLLESKLPLAAIELLQLQPSNEAKRSKPIQVEAANPTVQAKAEAAPEPEEQPSLGSTPPSTSAIPDTPSMTTPPAPGGALQMHLFQVMKQLRDNAGLERGMFALLAPDRQLLSARFVIGAEKDAAIKTFRVSLDRRHLFAVLMSKPQSFWLNAGNRAKYLPAIPQYLHSALNLQGFFISSLFLEEKPIGILYADSGIDAHLSDASFGYFKQMTQQLLSGLSGKATLHQAS